MMAMMGTLLWRIVMIGAGNDGNTALEDSDDESNDGWHSGLACINDGDADDRYSGPVDSDGRDIGDRHSDIADSDDEQTDDRHLVIFRIVMIGRLVIGVSNLVNCDEAWELLR